MRPAQLLHLPVYSVTDLEYPVNIVHVIDVIRVDYARRLEMTSLYDSLISQNATCALRTAESQFALWVPRGGMDRFSLLDQRIPYSNRFTNLMVHNDGSFFEVEEEKSIHRGFEEQAVYAEAKSA